MDDRFLQLLIFYPVLLVSLTIHEFCHGFVAFKKGDQTARLMGRLTLNPIPHLDPFGTVLFPIVLMLSGSSILFGWAKPVPVNPMNLKDRYNDMFWVALAGPLSNFVLAFFAAWIYGVTVSYGHHLLDGPMIKIFADMSRLAIYLNLFLCFFNLIPLAPLDGSKIVGRFLPSNIRSYLEQINPMYGGLFLLVLLFTGLLRYIAIPVFLIGNYFQQLFLS